MHLTPLMKVEFQTSVYRFTYFDIGLLMWRNKPTRPGY